MYIYVTDFERTLNVFTTHLLYTFDNELIITFMRMRNI